MYKYILFRNFSFNSLKRNKNIVFKWWYKVTFTEIKQVNNFNTTISGSMQFYTKYWKSKCHIIICLTEDVF